MALRTPAKPVDVELEFPFLSGRGRTTTRLHPRRGTPSRTDSSMGGPLYWPAGQSWPSCSDGHEESVFLLPVVQLWRRDVPNLPWRDGDDLFQLLWCPTDHDWFGPKVSLFWRESATLAGNLLDGSPVTDEYLLDLWDRDISEEELIPLPSRLTPEDVTDYPAVWELSEAERQMVNEWGEGRGLVYHYHLGAAPGSKVGGWPHWIQNPEWPSCSRGHVMEHLMTIASWECDGESWRTWLPQSDIDAMKALAEANGWPSFVNNLTTKDLGADIMLGDAGDMYVFICTSCPERPVQTVIQFS